MHTCTHAHTHKTPSSFDPPAFPKKTKTKQNRPHRLAVDGKSPLKQRDGVLVHPRPLQYRTYVSYVFVTRVNRTRPPAAAREEKAQVHPSNTDSMFGCVGEREALSRYCPHNKGVQWPTAVSDAAIHFCFCPSQTITTIINVK